MNRYYFGFGANTNIKHMQMRAPSAKWSGTAKLPGYQLKFRKHADIEKNPNSSVMGTLWIVDDAAIAELDKYEGYPNYYDRIKVEVWQDGEPMLAEVYIMIEQFYVDAPHRTYFNLCKEGYEQSGIPAEQLDKALEEIHQHPRYDPIFNRVKPSLEEDFTRSIMKNDYYD